MVSNQWQDPWTKILFWHSINTLLWIIRALRQGGCELFRIYGNTFTLTKLRCRAILTVEPKISKQSYWYQLILGRNYGIGHPLEPFKPLLGTGYFWYWWRAFNRFVVSRGLALTASFVGIRRQHLKLLVIVSRYNLLSFTASVSSAALESALSLRYSTERRQTSTLNNYIRMTSSYIRKTRNATSKSYNSLDSSGASFAEVKYQPRLDANLISNTQDSVWNVDTDI